MALHRVLVTLALGSGTILNAGYKATLSSLIASYTFLIFSIQYRLTLLLTLSELSAFFLELALMLLHLLKTGSICPN